MWHNAMRRLVPILIAAVLVVGFLPSGVSAQGGPVRIIFMHHSTGEGLIRDGGVRELFTALGYEFWDHGYNDEGLRDADGNYTGINWDVPGDNTDPDGWYDIFMQPFTDPPTNTFSHMLQFDVIIFKSCFPSSDIQSEEMLEEYRSYFLAMRDVMDMYPDHIFIPFTPPPLVPNSTTPENAARARRWAEYLTSEEYLAGHPNIFVFDFFNLLADESGYLRAEYRSDEWDSHPNELANQTIGPLFVAFVDNAVRSYTLGEPMVAPQPATVGEETGEEEGAWEEGEGEAVAAEPGALIEDFETLSEEEFADSWWSYNEASPDAFSCSVGGPGYSGARALQLSFNLPVEAYAGCGVDFGPMQDWGEADGLSFFWRSDREGLLMTVGVVMSDPDAGPGFRNVTIFENHLLSPGDSWEQVVLYWDDFEKAEWMGDAGSDELDLERVVGIGFDLGDWETPQAGTIWIDDIRLFGGELSGE